MRLLSAAKNYNKKLAGKYYLIGEVPAESQLNRAGRKQRVKTRTRLLCGAWAPLW